MKVKRFNEVIAQHFNGEEDNTKDMGDYGRDESITLNDIVNDNCRVTLSKATPYTYHVDIVKNIGGAKEFEIIGTANSLDDAIEDAIDIYIKKPKDGPRSWQYKSLPRI